MRQAWPSYDCWSEYRARRRDTHGILRFIYDVGCLVKGCDWQTTAVGMPNVDREMYLHKAWHSGRHIPPERVPKPRRDADPAF